MVTVTKPFKDNSKTNDDTFYDLIDDYGLIEASFAEQYGIRLRHEDDMTWNEFSTLLSGLNAKTPLGSIVGIRSEKDPKVIKEFSPEQKRIKNEWGKKQASKLSEAEIEFYNKKLIEAMKSMACN